MSVRRVVAIVVIFLVACGGWAVLGTTTALRSSQYADLLGEEVRGLWGAPLVQHAPRVTVEAAGSDTMLPLMPARNDLDVEMNVDYRQKGLVWYPTYKVHFRSAHTITNPEETAREVRFHFHFASPDSTYDAFEFLLNDQPVAAVVDTADGVDGVAELAPGESCTFFVAYRTRGLASWRYRIDRETGRVQNLNLAVTTDFEDVDYPEGSYAPTQPAEVTGGGATVLWRASDLITRQDMGVVVPERLNPGPLTSRITFFAPVCLIFFFVLVAAIGIVEHVDIHPMHYLFVAAGFGAFHVLLAYLVDHINIHVAFLLCATVSVGLVTSYMSAALKGTFPWRIAVAGQVFFLVLFSYSFFLQGMTGLTVAVGSVVTLAVLMRVTADVDWNNVFGRDRGSETVPDPVELG